MNTPVSFEIAKLLKEKGFDLNHEYMVFTSSETEKYPEGELFLKPTIADVAMWLYEKHGIWVSVDWMTRRKPFNSGFYCHLRGTSKPLNQDNFFVINDTLDPGYEVFNSPTKAYLAAIEYTLNNLI